MQSLKVDVLDLTHLLSRFEDRARPCITSFVLIFPKDTVDHLGDLDVLDRDPG